MNAPPPPDDSVPIAVATPLHGTTRAGDIGLRSATRFVVMIGVVSLFADMTYEAARSIAGPFLATLGASATVVGVVAGLGELIGYALRLLSGRLTDRTGRYWAITLGGYAVNLLAVPLLALAGDWPTAALLMFLERAGKAVRVPARDAMLSYASHRMGRGWGFGLHEALDQTGATLGPLIVAAVLYLRNGDYRVGFAVLLVPAVLALTTLLVARRLYPRPRELELETPALDVHGFARPFWLYLAAAACIAAGFADFPLIAYHFERTDVLDPAWIPLVYALTMGVDGLAAVILGRIYDRRGTLLIAITALLAVPAVPLLFLGGVPAALLGAVLWGIGMGAQESVMKAAVAEMSPATRRGTAFGLFNTGFGIAWFAGSASMGLLYDASVHALVGFSVLLQLAAVPLLLRVARSGTCSRT